jgi:hypothetical protein
MEIEAQRWVYTIEDTLEKLDKETHKSPSGIPLSSLPPIPEDTGLPPVDLTPADIIAGNWRGSQLPDKTPPPFDPRTHDDFPTSSLDWDSLPPEDLPDAPKPTTSDPPRPEDLHTSPLDWDSISPEDLPDAPKISPVVREKLNRLIASDQEKETHFSETMYTDEVPELSPEEIQELEDIFDADQAEGIHVPEEKDIDEAPVETVTEEEPPVEDSFLPFGGVDLSDDDVIVDDFVPGEFNNGEES